MCYFVNVDEHRILNATFIAGLSGISAVTLAVCFSQSGHSAFAVFAARQAAGIARFPVLLVTENAAEPGLAAAGVRVGVDGQAGAVNTPGDGKKKKHVHQNAGGQGTGPTVN